MWRKGKLVTLLVGMQETWVLSLGPEDPLEKKMATQSSILVWRLLWTEEPGGLESTGSRRVDMTSEHMRVMLRESGLLCFFNLSPLCSFSLTVVCSDSWSTRGLGVHRGLIRSYLCSLPDGATRLDSWF